jgi:hypothetical protein
MWLPIGISVFRHPGKPEGKNPCLRESRNPDHRNPEMARGVNEVRESRDLIVTVDHPEKITIVDLG